MSMLRSPLHDRHVSLGARMAEFAGWEMPLEYAGGGVLKEHTAVRESVGVFDVSHLGKLSVRGTGSAAFVNRCLSNDLSRIGPGRAQYTLCCDAESGGVVDDLIAYLRGEDEVFLVPNAANTAEVARRLAAAAPAGVEVLSQHRDFAVLAVQGSRSDDVLSSIGLPTGHDYMAFADAEFAGERVVVCRTGYTGERGYELVIASGAAPALWDAVMERGTGLLHSGLRSGRPRHAAHRDGVPPARSGHLAGCHAGASAPRLGGRMEEGRVLGPRCPVGREGRRSGAAAARSRLLGPGDSATAHGRRSTPTERHSVRSPRERSRRRGASVWDSHCSTRMWTMRPRCSSTCADAAKPSSSRNPRSSPPPPDLPAIRQLLHAIGQRVTPGARVPARARGRDCSSPRPTTAVLGCSDLCRR